jgi:hypothetical protein
LLQLHETAICVDAGGECFGHDLFADGEVVGVYDAVGEDCPARFFEGCDGGCCGGFGFGAGSGSSALNAELVLKVSDARVQLVLLVKIIDVGRR